jgi:hypothetical protein
MKILCLISTNGKEPFASILQEGTFPTWAKGVQKIEVCTIEALNKSIVVDKIDRFRENLRFKTLIFRRIGQILDLLLMPFIFYIPKINRVEDESNIKYLLIKMPEMLMLYRWRYLAGFRYFIDSTDCDYLYTVNASCFVNENGLLNYLANHTDIQYAGTPIEDSNKKYQGFFASGANRLISRPAVNAVLKNRFRWSPFLLEDVALGRLMHKLGIPLAPMPTLNLSTLADVKLLSDVQLKHNFHFRLKSYQKSGGKKISRNDVNLFKALFSRMKEF